MLVATHDVEFAATFADRAVLMADGRVIADGPVEEILAGGWYFATETARILDGAGGALCPSRGPRCCARRGRPPRYWRATVGATRRRPRRYGEAMSWQLASFGLVLAALGGAFWWYERSHPPAKLLAVIATLAALAALGRDAFAACRTSSRSPRSCS